MWCNAWKDGCAITVKVTPKASRNAVLGEETEWLRVALTAPPVDGKANEAARRFLAESLSVSRSAVSLLSGQTARLKRFAVAGVSVEQAKSLLLSGTAS
ncbi:MAG: DUF167 domain-containing protein [Kiritimatiellae bacterium]|nr:DUF167 domain-containing protein [Kiritimatiellia bacterium]